MSYLFYSQDLHLTIVHCCVALPHGAMGLSAVCDCGISWSYSLLLLLSCLSYIPWPFVYWKPTKQELRQTLKTLINVIIFIFAKINKLPQNVAFHQLLHFLLRENKTKHGSVPVSSVHIFNVWTIIMQSSNIKEWNLFEIQIDYTQITQCKYSKVIMSKFNTPKYIIKCG